jgi:hypothetical protein
LDWRSFIRNHYSRRYLVMAMAALLAIGLGLIILAGPGTGAGSGQNRGPADPSREILQIRPGGNEGRSLPAQPAEEADGSQAPAQPVTLDVPSSPGDREEGSYLHQEMAALAASYDFSIRAAVLPFHEYLGTVTPLAVRAGAASAIAQVLSAPEYWNRLAWPDPTRSDLPRGPFRAVRVGSIESLSPERFRCRIQLDSFSAQYFLEVVVYSSEESYQLEIFRYLQ